MKIGIPKEISGGERRVALVPGMVNVLTRKGHEVTVEAGAGEQSFFPDSEYESAGARIESDTPAVFKNAEVVLKFQPPGMNPALKSHEAEMISEGAILISFCEPLKHPDLVKTLAAQNISSFAMEYIPRITRAQSMDAVSSMSTVAGYKAAVLACARAAKFFPLLMTAAGTVPPAVVLVLGAGVAGLQAIATAKRLGAKVEAFDPRPSVAEQVQSLGGSFIEMELPQDIETKDGYAKMQSDEFLLKEREVIGARLGKADVVITTAQIMDQKAPLLITEEMVKQMRPGSVIVDLAADQDGNCELTVPDQTVVKHGVTVVGAVNLAATIPVHASQMYSKNLTNFFNHVVKPEDGSFDLEDEITKATCITHQGAIVSERVANALKVE